MPHQENAARTVVARVLAALWALLIAGLLLVPLPPEQEDYLPTWLARLLGPWADDLAHGALFFGLAYLLLGALGARRARKSLAFLGAVAYGALTEWLQPRISGRHGEWSDLVADAVGALGGVLVVVAWERGRHLVPKRAREDAANPPERAA